MNLTELPYEIEENIIKYLSYHNIFNYAMINRRAMGVSDVFFTRRAKIEDIPIELLPANNIAIRYLQLYYDREWLFKIKYSDDLKNCFKRVILEDDIEEIKWLVGIMKGNKGPDSQKAENISILSIYALENDRNIICEWLLYNLHEYDLKSWNTNNTLYNFFVILRLALNKRLKDIVYYILDEFSNYNRNIRSRAFAEFATANDLNNMEKMMTKYNLNILEYNEAIANVLKLEMEDNDPENLYTLKFLLQNYPGSKDDLDKFLIGPVFYPRRSTLPILVEYGFDRYIAVLYRMTDIIYGNDELFDEVKWFLLNYGNMIPIESLKEIHDDTYNNKMKTIISEYISNI